MKPWRELRLKTDQDGKDHEVGPEAQNRDNPEHGSVGVLEMCPNDSPSAHVDLRGNPVDNEECARGQTPCDLLRGSESVR
jgi:hypothetical protein